MIQLSILLDSQEQSITAAREYYEAMEVPLKCVKVIRHKNFPTAFRKITDQAGQGEMILISMDFIDLVELNSVTNMISGDDSICKKKELKVELISFDCFKHIEEWCDSNKVKFIKNELKCRKLEKDKWEKISEYLESNSNFWPKDLASAWDDIVRIWIQYRMMIAIISRSQLLGSIAKELIIQQDPSKEDLARAFRFFTLKELDLVGGTYFGEKDGENVIDQLRNRISKIAATEFHVLIQGESGTGKESVAWAIHEMSKRRDKPFLTLNCAGFSEQLLESQLFGHIKGAFTGAVKQHDGILKKANGGTVFLDEVSDMEPRVQAKLLRFLDSGEYRSVGDEGRNKYIDVRIICAGQGHYLNDPSRIRPDLIARIGQLTIDLSPLRDFGKEIFLKICHALIARNTWKIVKRDGENYVLTPEDIRIYQDILRKSSKKQDLLKNAEWRKSNVRELNNFIRHWLFLGEEQFDRLSSGIRESSEENTKIGMASIPLVDYGVFAPYLVPFNSYGELEVILQPENFLKNIQTAYVQYINNRCQQIKTAGGEKKSQADLAHMLKIDPSTLSRSLKEQLSKNVKDPVQ